MKGECFESALELGGGVVVVFFSGGRGPVSFRAVKGEGGPVSFGVGCETVRRRRRRRRRRRLFLFWAGGGPVSFRVCVLLLRGMEAVSFRVCVLSSAGNGGESASGGAKGKWGQVSFRGCEGEMIMKGMGSESASDGEGADVFFFF